MKREEMNRILSEELAGIPRGDLSQNSLRSIYNAFRRHDLALDPSTPRNQSLERALGQLRASGAGSTPTYDRDLFSP